MTTMKNSVNHIQKEFTNQENPVIFGRIWIRQQFDFEWRGMKKSRSTATAAALAASWAAQHVFSR